MNNNDGRKLFCPLFGFHNLPCNAEDAWSWKEMRNANVPIDKCDVWQQIVQLSNEYGAKISILRVSIAAIYVRLNKGVFFERQLQTPPVPSRSTAGAG